MAKYLVTLGNGLTVNVGASAFSYALASAIEVLKIADPHPNRMEVTVTISGEEASLVSKNSGASAKVEPTRTTSRTKAKPPRFRRPPGRPPVSGWYPPEMAEKLGLHPEVPIIRKHQHIFVFLDGEGETIGMSEPARTPDYKVGSIRDCLDEWMPEPPSGTSIVYAYRGGVKSFDRSPARLVGVKFL